MFFGESVDGDEDFTAALSSSTSRYNPLLTQSQTVYLLAVGSPLALVRMLWVRDLWLVSTTLRLPSTDSYCR